MIMLTRSPAKNGFPFSSLPILDASMRLRSDSLTNGSSMYDEILMVEPSAADVCACQTGRLVSAIVSIINLQTIKRFDIVNLLLVFIIFSIGERDSVAHSNADPFFTQWG
ncbi:MAG TPA: hypothetical protein VJ464_06910 [Blastocatellia bacterium]|nr:hypothetical protein [Blastocatellia bacterium]